jgi:hypothetical protein
MKLFASRHAILRARERVHWTQQALERMIERAYYVGIEPDDCPRGLREYLHSLCHEFRGSIAKLYGEFVYVFCPTPEGDSMALVTLYQLDFAKRRQAQYATSRWWQGERQAPSTENRRPAAAVP